MHKQCPNCQQLLDESARFCPICGNSVSEVKPLDSPIEISQEQLPPPLIPENQAQEPSFIPETSPAMPAPPASNYPPPPSAPLNLTRPALLAGAILGVASALPIVSCCCWLWVVAGGILAVYFLRQETADEISTPQGAKLGFLTGAFGAIVWEVMSIPLALIFRSRGIDQFQEIFKSAENLPPETARIMEWFLQFINQPFHPLVLFFGLASKLAICAIFTTVGGILGVAFFGKAKK
jgi:hypothetical protein